MGGYNYSSAATPVKTPSLPFQINTSTGPELVGLRGRSLQ